MAAQSGGPQMMLRRLRQVMVEPGDGQQRLDKIVKVIATYMAAEVCSIYLRRDERVLELCATEGLRPEAVHTTRLRVGQGLVGLIAERAEPFATANAPNEPSFEYRPETGEEIYTSFCGVPIQRLGRIMGVLVVQNAVAKMYEQEEIDALEVTAMVIAEMAESGQLIGGEGVSLARTIARTYDAVGAAEGVAVGVVHLHEPKLAITQPFTDDVDNELSRLDVAMSGLRDEVDRLLSDDMAGANSEYRDVLEAYAMFAHDKGWLRRLKEAVSSGVVAEVAVERVQSAARARMERAPSQYMRDRLHDLDDIANRLLRRLTGANGAQMPDGAVLVARSIGPGELLDLGGKVSAVVSEEGGVGSHAAIVARQLEIPMIVGAEKIVGHAENGDPIAVNGDMGMAFLRPDAALLDSYREKLTTAEAARARYRALRDLPAESLDGRRVSLQINAGLVSDLPQLFESGAEGVGLFRTELQFLVRATLPTRSELATIYGRVMDAARGHPVVFRTLDIGSDKVLPFMRRPKEDNPALGWRALRVGLDRPHVLKWQLQAMLRGAGARPLRIMFPFVAEEAEFFAARDLLWETHVWLQSRGYTVSDDIQVGAMLETPSLAYASDAFFEATDFVSVGGNDLLQFLFAADRGNERVRRRYDPLHPAFIRLLAQVSARCKAYGTRLSFCGEAASRPAMALSLTALGFDALSMRPLAIGPVKQLIRSVDMTEAEAELNAALAGRPADFAARMTMWAESQTP
ncbi:MAG: phosphoenolpyruvate--protein phosphotransferase [Pseudomonadota bacterium]